MAAAATHRLASDLRYAMNPVAFARSNGIEADDWQASVLCSRSKRLILCCSRQSGKSTTVAMRTAHRSIYMPGRLTLCVSPSLRQSGELFAKIAGYIKGRAATTIKPIEDNRTVLRLENGSRVISLPDNADTIRGFSPHEVLIDEAAFVSDSTFAAVRPMLIVSGGDLALLSTPYGKRGEFYETWEHGGDEWERMRVPAEKCPRIKAEDLARERREMPAWLYRQEYGCEFVETLDAVFTSEQIDGAMVDGAELSL